MIPTRYRFAKACVWLCLISCILLLAYSFYKNEITSHLSVGRYTKYYFIFSVGAVFWAGVLWLRDEIKLNIIMVTISLAVGVILIEIALEIMPPIIKTDPSFDTRTKLQVYWDIKDKTDATVSIHPYLLVGANGMAEKESLLPFGGVSKKTTVYCNESGKYSIYQSDRYGFNNKDSEWDASRAQWLLTGDSFAQGACVDTVENIAGQIRLLTKETVINLGSNGNGPLTELAALREYANLKKPKKVLWIYYEGNDLIEDLEIEKTSPLLMNYLQLDFTQNLVHRQEEIDSKLIKFIELNREIEERQKRTRVLRLYNIRKLIALDSKKSPGSVDINPLFSEILINSRDLVAEWGGQLIFVYLPEFSRYETELVNHDTYRKRKEVIEVVKNLDIPVIDIHKEVFLKHPDPLSLFPYHRLNHYNAKGYSRVSKAIVTKAVYE